VTIHDLQYKRHPEDLTFLERLVLDTLVRWACKSCRAIIAVSEFSKTEIVKYCFADSTKVHVVLEGVSRSFSLPVKKVLIESELKTIPLDHPFILCVAHTYPHKNVDLLVDAFNEIQESIAHNLVIIGMPRLGEHKVEKAVARMNNAARLYRINKGISAEALKYLFQKSDLFVLPSAYEGFGLPVLEAMMAGTLVICSSEASIPEVGGRFALYLKHLTRSELSSQMIRATEMSNNSKLDICREAKKWAETFTWKRAAHQMVKVFSFCVKK
jgi:glycosyltransferase involved in cell wall biosynthesis